MLQDFQSTQLFFQIILMSCNLIHFHSTQSHDWQVFESLRVFYFNRKINQYEDPESDNSLPVQASLLPIIAIIGRPNTGKSTIVNRLTDSFKDGAIVHDEPGITRDRTYRSGMWNDYNFQCVDTGG